MPLTGNPSKDIPELMRSGRPQKQAIAIALKKERGDDDCDEREDDRSSEGHEKEAARLKALAEKETDPTIKKELEEKAEFHTEEEGVADAKKSATPTRLLDMVERIRNDMISNREGIDKLAGKIYNTSSRIRRLEER